MLQEKTLPRHVKGVIAGMISLMTTTSGYFVWYVPTKGDGTLVDVPSWNGADSFAFGSLTIIAVELVGIAYVLAIGKSRD